MRDSLKQLVVLQRRKALLALSLACAVCITLTASVVASRTTAVVRPDEEALVSLGRTIFFDRTLSSDGSVACASCHRPEHAFTDGLPTAVGVEHSVGTRNTPSLIASTRTEKTSFFWDGRRRELRVAVLDAFSNPTEMGLSDHEIVAKLNSSPGYRPLLRDAFGEHGKSTAQEDQIAAALIAYLRSAATLPTAYERYASGKDAKAMSNQALMGMSVFMGKGQCATCHSLSHGALTDESFHRSGVGLESIEADLPALTADIIEHPIEANKLGGWVATHPSEAQLGRFNVTRSVADIETFATPSLSHVSETAPYMHDGSVTTLDAAIDRETYYRSLDTGHPIGLTKQERSDLRSFLEAL